MARRLRTTNLKDWERRLASLKNNKPLMKNLRSISDEELMLVWNQKVGKTLGPHLRCLTNCQAVKTAYPESEIVGGWRVSSDETERGINPDYKPVWGKHSEGFALDSHFNIKRVFRGESELRVSNITPCYGDYHIFLPDSKRYKNPQILHSVFYIPKGILTVAERRGFRTQYVAHPLAGKILVEVSEHAGRKRFYSEDLRYVYANCEPHYTDEECIGFPNANRRRVFRNNKHVEAYVYGSKDGLETVNRKAVLRYYEKTLLEYGFKKNDIPRVLPQFFPGVFSFFIR